MELGRDWPITKAFLNLAPLPFCEIYACNLWTGELVRSLHMVIFGRFLLQVLDLSYSSFARLPQELVWMLLQRINIRGSYVAVAIRRARAAGNFNDPNTLILNKVGQSNQRAIVIE